MSGPTSAPLTLADVRERISGDESLTENRRKAVRISSTIQPYGDEKMPNPRRGAPDIPCGREMTDELLKLILDQGALTPPKIRSTLAKVYRLTSEQTE